MHMNIDEYREMLGKDKLPEPARHGRKAVAVRAAHEPGRMNKLETQYAAHLEILKRAGTLVDWRFEPVRLTLAPRTTYTPDFMVITTALHIWFVEVKGHWEDDARVKIKMAAELFPWFTFFAVTQKRGDWHDELIR